MQRFLTSFIVFVALAMGGLVWLAFAMEPYAGTATRRGGYLERDYGWRAPQVYQAQHLFEEITDPSDANGADVLVVGDSFSNSPNSWPDYFVEQTGLTTKVIHFSKAQLKSLDITLASLPNPPKLVVLISQEWLAAKRFASLARCDNVGNIAKSEGVFLKRPVEGNRKAHHRREARSFGEKVDIALSYTKKRIMHETVLETPIHRFEVDFDSAFSGRQSNILLAEPRGRASFTATTLTRAEDGIKCFAQHLAKAGVKTAIAVVPSPLQAYWHHIVERDRNVHPLPAIFSDALGEVAPALPVDLLTPLRAAVGAGVKDLYLANDHHTGTAGYQIISDQIVSSLLEDDVLLKNPAIEEGLRPRVNAAVTYDRKKFR